MQKILPSRGRGVLALILFCALGHGKLRATSSWDGKSPVDHVLSVETDHADALYKRGETITFHIKLTDHQQPAAEGEITWKVTKDFSPPIAQGKTPVRNGTCTVSQKLDDAGFLVCEVEFTTAGGKISAVASAGVDVLQLKPSLPVPADFDAFWNAKKAQLAALPMNAKLTPVAVPPERRGIEAFDVQLDCLGGAPVSGYYARPIGAKPKSLPAQLSVDGAGVRSANLVPAMHYAQDGIITYVINAHGVPNGKPNDFYTDLADHGLKDYRTRGRESRDDFYFVGMYLRVLRALEFLEAQPEWDGRILLVQGVSQGGGQAIAAAALDPKVSFTFVGFPGLCDFSGTVAGRTQGWPKPVPTDRSGKPEPKALEATRYCDGVNLASRIRSAVYFYIGFIDPVTPPTGEYAAYNAVPGPKEVRNLPSNGHGRDEPNFWQMLSEMIGKKVAEQKR